MRGILLTFLGIIIGLIILAKLPLVLGYLLNTLGFRPGMDSHIDEMEKQKFDEEKEKYEKEAMPDIYGFSLRFGR